MNIKIKKLNENCIIPQYMTDGAAAMDVFSCLEAPVTVQPHQRALIPTGFAVGVPTGYVAILCARSGLAFKNGISLANGIGVIDSDYRGEVKAAILNNSDTPFTVENGMRIAQMMIMPVENCKVEVVDELDSTLRGEGGFGSTGVNK